MQWSITQLWDGQILKHYAKWKKPYIKDYTHNYSIDTVLLQRLKGISGCLESTNWLQTGTRKFLRWFKCSKTRLWRWLYNCINSLNCLTGELFIIILKKKKKGRYKWKPNPPEANFQNILTFTKGKRLYFQTPIVLELKGT